MKNMMTAILLGMFATMGIASANDIGPALITKVTERVFTPHGFDDNDNVQVVLDGELQSTCYRAGPVEASVDKDTKTIRIHDHNYFYEGCWCAEVVTPYVRAVDIGILPHGNYSVVVENDEGRTLRKGAMNITLATTLAPDDFLYAPVSEASVSIPTDGSNPKLTLRGNFSNTCMTLKEIRPTYSPGNVIEVLPIADMKSENCAEALVPFTVTVPLTNVPKGRTLVHVRSLNGQALNQVYTF